MQTIAIVDSTTHPRAVEYFETFPSEAVLPQPNGLLQIDRPPIPIARMSLFDLLSTISRQSAVRNIVTVSHGNTVGLTIPLIQLQPKEWQQWNEDQGRKQVLGETEQHLLLKYVEGTIDENVFGSTVDWDNKRDVEKVKQDLPKLKELILKVRSRTLDKWVIRACEIGSSPASLQNLRLLLGATVVCAPKKFDFFGSFNPKPVFGRPDAFAKFLEEKRPIVDGQAPHRFAWTPGNILTGFKLDVVPESKDASAKFVAKHFPKGKYSGQGRFPVHAIVSFGVETKWVFPMDPQYRELLTRVGG